MAHFHRAIEVKPDYAIAHKNIGSMLGVCGEMGGRRLEALALLGIGYRRLSITPAAVGPIKELVRKVDLNEITEQMNRWLASPPENLRAELQRWAADRDIDTE